MTSKVDLVSVVIPTLNEAGNIVEVIDTVEKEIRYPYEIIIVDGGSTDGTRKIVKNKNCKLIIETRRGYGLALRLGMKQAKGNIMVMVDGDGTYELKHINIVLDRLIEKDAELCLATRMFDPNKAMGMMNFVGNKVITFCFNMLYKQNLSDSQSGYRAISKIAFDKIEFKEDDMAFATEMLVKFSQKKFKMVEIPTIYKERKYGKPKLRRFKSGIEIFTTMLKGVTERPYE
jgi:glycosyltransferase involved in cell wall biosynthesis